MLSEEILFCFKIEQVWHFQDQSDRFFVKNSILRIKVLDDLEVDMFVFGKDRLDFLNVLNRVNSKDLIEELIVLR